MLPQLGANGTHAGLSMSLLTQQQFPNYCGGTCAGIILQQLVCLLQGRLCALSTAKLCSAETPGCAVLLQWVWLHNAPTSAGRSAAGCTNLHLLYHLSLGLTFSLTSGICGCNGSEPRPAQRWVAHTNTFGHVITGRRASALCIEEKCFLLMASSSAGWRTPTRSGTSTPAGQLLLAAGPGRTSC